MTSPADSPHRDLRILSVGSQPDQKRAGGVITHMRILRSLDALGRLDVFDVGSLHGTAALKTRFAPLLIVSRIWKLRQMTRETWYDLVLVHQPITGPALVKLALILSALPASVAERTLVFFHGGRFERVALLRNPLIKRFVRAAFERARRFYFLSRPEFTGFSGTFSNLPAAYFRNFSETDELLQPSGDHSAVNLLYVGRIVRIKGVFDIVDAIRTLRSRGTTAVTATFVGHGPDLEALRRASEGLPGIRFTGYLGGDDLEKTYAEADVLLLPTGHPEGFPYVIIEAMRAGLPIVSTSEGALEDLVEDGVNGYRIAFGDVPALTDAIERLTDVTRRQTIAENNRRRFLGSLSRSQAEVFYADLVERETGTAGRSGAPRPS